MKKCTMVNNDQLTSLRLFDVGLFVLKRYLSNQETSYSSINDVTNSVEIGHLAFVLVLTLVKSNAQKHKIMPPTGQ